MSSLHGLEDSLRNSFAVLDLVRDVSSKVTHFVRGFCERLGLDRGVEVLISLRRFDEIEKEGIIGVEERGRLIKEVVCGYYDPRRRLIVLSLPCVVAKRSLDKTIAHELIHHCQYTRGSSTSKSVCRVSLSVEQGEEVEMVLPYFARPHEIEAYDKQEELAKRLREIEEYKEVESLVERLYCTLNFNQNVKIHSSRLMTRKAKAVVMLLGTTNVITYCCLHYMTEVVPALLDIYMGAFGRDHLISIIEQATKIYYEELLRNAERDVRERFERKVQETLRSRELTSIAREEQFRRQVEEIPKAFFQTTNVKSMILSPRGDDMLELHVVTDRGYALCIVNKLAPLPLVPLLLMPKKDVNVEDVFSGDIGLKLTYDQVIQGTAQVNLPSNKLTELKVLLGKGINVIEELKGLCKEFRSSSTLRSLELIALISLLGWTPHKHLLLLEELNGMIKVWCRSREEAEETEGVLICGDLKISGGVLGMSCEIGIKEALEKLNDVDHHKDFLENFIIKTLIDRLLWKYYIECAFERKIEQSRKELEVLLEKWEVEFKEPHN